MDAADRSFPEENARIEAAIKLSKNYSSGYKPVGRCLSCDEDVAQAKLYCDNLCATDHAKVNTRLGKRT